MSYIYALKLKNNKYYVGKTNVPDMRLEQHQAGEGASWTKLYEPVEVLYVQPSTSVFDEDLHVKNLMLQYGIETTRGGSYSSIVLSESQLDVLIKEMCSAKNLCFICAESGHFASNCPNQKKVKKKVKKMDYDKNVECTRCGRRGHNKSHCMTKTKANGKEIKVPHCSYCGSSKHNKKSCMLYKLQSQI